MEPSRLNPNIPSLKSAPFLLSQTLLLPQRATQSKCMEFIDSLKWSEFQYVYFKFSLSFKLKNINVWTNITIHTWYIKCKTLHLNVFHHSILIIWLLNNSKYVIIGYRLKSYSLFPILPLILKMLPLKWNGSEKYVEV